MDKLKRLEELCTDKPYHWLDISDRLDEHMSITKYKFVVTSEGGFRNTTFEISYYTHSEAGFDYLGYIIRHSVLGTVYKGWIKDSDMLELIIRQVLRMKTN